MAIPVMIHNEEEIETFKEAKARMESKFPIKVGVFTYLPPFTLNKGKKDITPWL